jgi:ribosomal-protein-alanine N-acetyltransferase
LEGVIIRDMSHEDLPQVHALDELFYGTPWSITSFSYELGNQEAILKVATYREQVVGYICIRTLLDVTHVLKITVMTKFRRRGIGGRLLHEAIQKLRHFKPDTGELTLEVRESNRAAIDLYEKSGFTKTGIRRGYYKRPDEDALIMGMKLRGKK